ncbi:E3 ubiquitin-protein ligase SH3RF2 [Tachyglossus aculeatus]|uniref:E3 ubiquitin-protein ligase SH3RF2 n=1 Tax=Tachyglossus aculeatus TaxID=9261 RepID=UPI0018F4D1A3|nr:E3 ubiquitin-protein ligase SH3RF2 [Tachyglossus aculeatus]
MDDLDLLSLLECPVCLEKLDVTAKVLPCQHTFCQPCLQRIFKARKELRCPECRTLVFCSIEELPANLLLVRLLDGVRSGRGTGRVGSFRRPRALTSQDGGRRGGAADPRAGQPSPFRLVSNSRAHMEGVPRAKALCNYRGQHPSDLRFNKGDIIILRRQLDENWYEGEVNGTGGTFPASSVQIIKQLPQPPPLCRALYNFDLRERGKAESEGCLTFLKDDIITVISRVDENWAEGKLGDKVGIFPILFVEPNFTARHLLEKGKSPQAFHTKSMSLRHSSPRAKVVESPTFCGIVEPRRKSPRQFSITTALNTLNRMVHSPPGRHSVEISSPVLISSSNPSVTAQNGDRVDFTNSLPGQVGTTYYSTSGPLGPSSAIVTLPYSQQHISANMYVALHSFSAHGPDELDLQKGEGIRVLGKYHEGWLKGVSLVTGRIGIFPQNYVVPLFRKTSSFSDSRTPTLYATWTLSASSASSQGSISDGGPRQSRAPKSILVPTAVVTPVRSMTGPRTPTQMSLRRGRSSMRKTESLPRSTQPSMSVSQVSGSLRRQPTVLVRPQQCQPYQPHPSSPGPCLSMAEAGPRLALPGELVAGLLARGPESRTHSAANSLILEARGSPVKSEPPTKPPASAPPSILVKPDNSRNSSEKQVKTVRFQNYSPPPPKQSSSLSKLDLPASPEASQQEPGLSTPEMTTLFVHRGGTHYGQHTEPRRKPTYAKAAALTLPTPVIQPIFPGK